MTKNFADEWSKLKINKEEDRIIDRDFDKEGENINNKFAFIFIGKLCTENFFFVLTLKRVINVIWKIKEGCIINVLDINFFIFQLYNFNDKIRVFVVLVFR